MATGTYNYQSEFARRYFGQGEAKGKAAAVLGVLDARAIDVPADAHDRIAQCTDLDQLDVWVRRAVVADVVGDLFTTD